jgi:putative flippase GtrA
MTMPSAGMALLRNFLSLTATRYLIVGGSCAAFNNIVLIAGDAAGFPYVASAVLAFLLVLPASYLAHALWSFTTPASWSAFLHYAAGSCSGLVVTVVVLAVFRTGLMLPMVAAAPLATVCMMIYNYLMARWAVHRGRR